MNAAPLVDYVVDTLDVVSVTLVLGGVCLVLACQFLGVAGRYGIPDRKEERNHSKEVT